MAGMYIGLCSKDACDELARALRTVDPGASLSFASSAQELRHWVREAGPGTGAVVGLLDEGVSDVNVAAALVRDGYARDVVLVARGVDESLAMRARRAGVRNVVDALALPRGRADDLDEPDLPAEEVPTMVMGADDRRRRLRLEDVPQVDGPQHASAPDVPKGAFAKRVANGATPMGTPVIGVVSGRGGVGKTSLVAAMGHAAASWGMRVALLDADLACGNLYSCFGSKGPVDLAALVSAKDSPGEATTSSPRADPVGLADVMAAGRELAPNLVLWGPCKLPETAELVAPHVEELLETLRRQFDLVLVDTSTAFDDTVAQVVQACERLLIVVDGLPGSTVAQARLGALAVRLGVARTRIVRVANRSGRKGWADASVNRADVGLETARTLRVLDGGWEVTECMAEGNVGELFDVGSRFALSSSTALARLLAELGALPDHEEARHALERKVQPSRWAFGRKREVV